MKAPTAPKYKTPWSEKTPKNPPILYHGTSVKGLEVMIQERRLPKDRLGWGNAVGFTSRPDVAGNFAEIPEHGLNPFRKKGTKAEEQPLLLVFKQDFPAKAGLYPIRYTKGWLSDRPHLAYHITKYNPNVMDWEDERAAVPSAVGWADEREWVGDNENFPIKDGIEKILVIDGTPAQAKRISKEMGLPAEAVTKSELPRSSSTSEECVKAEKAEGGRFK
jgi:hypothetical protein